MPRRLVPAPIRAGAGRCPPRRDAPERPPHDRRLRLAGSPWRLLAHQWLGRSGDEPRYGRAFHVTNHAPFGYPHTGHPPADSDDHKTIELPGTEIDEVVCGRWLHVEAKDTGRWWMSVGGVVIWVDVDRDGRPTNIAVYGPNDYDAPVDGCAYQLTWTEPDGMQ